MDDNQPDDDNQPTCVLNLAQCCMMLRIGGNSPEIAFPFTAVVIFFPRTGAYPCSSMSIVVLSLKIIPMSTNRGQYDAVFCVPKVMQWTVCVCVVSCVLCRVRLELKPDTLWGSTNGINDIHFSNFKKITGIQQFNPNAQCLIVPWSLHLEVAYHSSKYCV